MALFNTHTGKGRSSMLLPFYGCLLFVCLYVLATLFYPGGSQAGTNTAGFSWSDNYWCNLLAPKAQNGAVNTARPFAFAALVILIISLSIFWMQTGKLGKANRPLHRLVQICGILSMGISFFIFTGWHDQVINIAGGFGLVAVVGLLYLLASVRWYLLLGLGFLNVLLIILNNVLYHTDHLHFLPVVQKISFLAFLLWISLICLKQYRRPQHG